MATNTGFTQEQLVRIRQGLTTLRWAFLFYLLPAAYSSLSGYGYFGLWWTSFVPPLLGIIAVTKIRSVIVEMLPTAPKKAAAPTVPRQRDAQTERRELAAMVQSAPATPRAVERKVRKPSAFENVNWEEWVGKKLMQKVGILIVLIGMVVFLKYSFDNRLIGELGRIALSALGAAALLLAGEWFHKKFTNWSHAFTGGGLALLYFTVWAAHVFYHDILLAEHGFSISPTVALALYSFITVIGALAAIRYNAQVIGWFTILGGYLTPALIDSPGNPTGLTLYLSVLAAGMLLLAWHKRWPLLTLAAFTLTQVYMFTQVYGSLQIADVQQVIFAIGFFALFAIPPLLSQFKLREKVDFKDILLIVGNGAVTWFAVVDGMGGTGGDYVGLVSLVLAAIYMVFAALALEKRKDDAMLVNMYLLGSIGLVAVALYAQMTWTWVAAGWAPLSVALLMMGTKLRQRSIFHCATALLVGSFLFLAINVPPAHAEAEALWHPFTSHWALLSYVVFACVLGWMAIAKSLPTEFIRSRDEAVKMKLSLHTALALLMFVGITFEATGLTWAISLPLALSYMGFAVVAILLFALTNVPVWFVAALVAQVVVVLFTFVLGDSSGMVSPLLDGPAAVPFLHPWGGVSLASLVMIGGLLWTTMSKKDSPLNKKSVHNILIGLALAQVWTHVTVEIQHMQMAYLWSGVLYNRILSGWWIVFTVPLFVWAIRKDEQKVLRTAIAVLCLPLLKDWQMLFYGTGNLYEVGVWTVVPFILIVIASHFKKRDLLMAGGLMLAGTMAVDTLNSVRVNASVVRTIWWALVGLATMILGFAKQEQFVRRLAMAIFGATVIKLLFIDFANLETGVRIIATIITGLLLIGASYLYQRFDSQLSKSR